MTFDFEAGKYAPYLWSAVALMVIVMGFLTVDTLSRARLWRKKAEALLAEKQARESGT